MAARSLWRRRWEGLRRARRRWWRAAMRIHPHSKTLLPLLLSPGEQRKEGLHGAGPLGVGLGPPPREQRKEGRRRWESWRPADYNFYKGTSHNLNTFVYPFWPTHTICSIKWRYKEKSFAGHAIVLARVYMELDQGSDIDFQVL
jgi:hypothetical protein